MATSNSWLQLKPVPNNAYRNSGDYCCFICCMEFFFCARPTTTRYLRWVSIGKKCFLHHTMTFRVLLVTPRQTSGIGFHTALRGFEMANSSVLCGFGEAETTREAMAHIKCPRDVRASQLCTHASLNPWLPM